MIQPPKIYLQPKEIPQLRFASFNHFYMFPFISYQYRATRCKDTCGMWLLFSFSFLSSNEKGKGARKGLHMDHYQNHEVTILTVTVSVKNQIESSKKRLQKNAGQKLFPLKRGGRSVVQTSRHPFNIIRQGYYSTIGNFENF